DFWILEGIRLPALGPRLSALGFRPSGLEKRRSTQNAQNPLNLFAKNAPRVPRLLRCTSGASTACYRREPKAQSREPKAENREPKAQSREPKAQSREPKAQSREPIMVRLWVMPARDS